MLDSCSTKDSCTTPSSLESDETLLTSGDVSDSSTQGYEGGPAASARASLKNQPQRFVEVHPGRDPDVELEERVLEQIVDAPGSPPAGQSAIKRKRGRHKTSSPGAQDKYLAQEPFPHVGRDQFANFDFNKSAWKRSATQG